MTVYRLKSNDDFYTPDFIEWAIVGCHSADDRRKMTILISSVFPKVPDSAIEQLLSKAVPYTVEEGTVVFQVDDHCGLPQSISPAP